MENPKHSKRTDVLVEGNLIKQISKEPLMVIQTDNVTIINGEGRTLMPGLTDCHWHSMASNMAGDPFAAGAGKLNLVAAHGAEKTLMRGFTTVRDLGGTVFDLKSVIDEGMYEKQILIKNVSIFDGNSEKLITGKDVVVEGNKTKKHRIRRRK